MDEKLERFDTLGRVLKTPDGTDDFIITEWDSKRDLGRETRITGSGERIYETSIGRETYNWARGVA